MNIHNGLGVEDRQKICNTSLLFLRPIGPSPAQTCPPTPKFQNNIIGWNMVSSVQEVELALSGPRRIAASSRSLSTLIYRLGLSQTT